MKYKLLYGILFICMSACSVQKEIDPNVIAPEFRINEDRIKNIHNYPTPSSTHELQFKLGPGVIEPSGCVKGQIRGVDC